MTKVGYVMSRFPKLTETFVLFEMLAVEEHGTPIEVYPLLRGSSDSTETAGASFLKKVLEYISANRRTSGGQCVMHEEARGLIKRAHYQPFFSWQILAANLHFLLVNPLRYLGALLAVVRGGWGNANFTLGGLSIFPKCARIARMMTRDGVSHIHAHFANHPATAAFIIHRLSGIPYSFTAHGSDLHRDRRLLKEKVDEAAFVVAISEYNRDVILDECGQQSRDKIVIVHCGVDTEVFQPVHASVSRTRESTSPLMLCIGTLHEVKGQAYLLKACRLLHERGVDFALHLVGDGPDRAGLSQQAAESGITDRVVFHGRKDRQAVAELVGRADVVVAPSVPTRDGRREGIPVVLMEAMSAGVSVVASGISGIPELIDDEVNGLLVPPREPQALSDAFVRLFNDVKLRERLGHAAREKILREFDVRTNAAMLTEFFHGTRNPAISTSGFEMDSNETVRSGTEAEACL